MKRGEPSGYAPNSTGYGVYGTGQHAVYGSSSDTSGAGVGVYGVAGYGGNGVEGSCSGPYCYAGYFSGNVYTTGTYGSSDIRLKKNVAPIAGGLDELLKLRGVTYEWTNPEEHANQTGIQRGFIAQEVEKVFPGWVGQDPKGFKTLSVQQIEALEVESIRTLKLQNDLLAERIKELESGRRPLVSGIDLNGVGFGIGGLAIAGAIVFVARRKREEQPRMIASS